MASNTHEVTAKDSFLKNTYLMAMAVSHLQEYDEKWCLLNLALTSKDFLDVALDALWEGMDSFLPLLELLPSLQVKDDVCFLGGSVSKEDWDRLQYYSRRVKHIYINLDTDCFHIHPSTYSRFAQLQSPLFPSLRRLNFYFTESFGSHIFLFLSPLLDSLEIYNLGTFEDTVVGPFLATLSSSPQMLRRIVLDGRQMSVESLKFSFFYFKQLRSVEISFASLMTDISFWEVLGTLPSLEKFTVEVANDSESLPVDAPENSNSRSGGLRNFEALESLHVTGPFFFIHHLLGFINSPFLKSIEVSPYRHNSEREHDAGDLLIPSMAIVASKWSQSLKELMIGENWIGITHRNSKFLVPLADLHGIQKFELVGWRMEKNNDALRRLAMSWPKLRHLELRNPNQTLISLSNLRIIAENCLELRILDIELDIDNIPPFDDISGKILCHELEVLVLRGVHQSIPQISLECQIQIARHLDFIFPYVRNIRLKALDRTWSGICDLVKLCQDARRGR